MRGGLTRGKVLAGGIMVVLTYFVITQVVLRLPGTRNYQEACQTAQGHIDGNYVDRGGHTLTLVEYDNIFKTRRNETTYDRVTQRMLNAGPGQRIELCYDADDATSIIKGRIMRELETTP